VTGTDQLSGDQAPADLIQPRFSVVRGNPDSMELAALAEALFGRLEAGAAADTDHGIRTSWTDRTRLLRATFVPGPDAWRRSAAPR
jgi:hypothetical protein